MIGLVDYGLGNIQAFANIYKQLGLPVTIARTPAELRKADKLILPGVGAFDWAMGQLNRSGLRETLDELVLEQDIHILGICVGMQMMATRSDEGRENGLGWIDAVVRKFETADSAPALPLPHMGWNNVQLSATDKWHKKFETCYIEGDWRGGKNNIILIYFEKISHKV